MKSLHRPILAAISMAGTFPQQATAEEPAMAAGETTNLLTNGNFETDSKTQAWPDHWPKLKAGGSWETENGNHFLRMTSTVPGSTVMLYREVPIPAGTEALEMTWRQRVTNLKVGSQAWFDARIMMEFKDANNAKVSPAPSAPYVRKDTEGWQEKSARFPVPAGAVALKFMPSLFQVETGTFDLDDIVIKPVAAAAKPPTP